MSQEENSKKGTSPWVWVGVGCAGIVVLTMLLFVVGGYFIFDKARDVKQGMEEDPVGTMATFAAAINPDIEVLDTDEDNGLVRFRNSKTGEEFQFTYEDIESGRFSFTSDGETSSFEFDGTTEDGGEIHITSDEGTTTFSSSAGIDGLPDWLPVYPDADAEGAYASSTPEGRSGAFTFKTTSGIDEVVAFYKEVFVDAGLQIQNETTMGDGAVLLAMSEDQGRSAQLSASAEDDGVSGMVNFTEK